MALLIIDSCRSGAATRAKGLKPLSGATVAIEAGPVRGRVVMGSSGADEDSQESDSLGGSYFTYHLIQALRGAGDLSHDGMVTLQEAYSYAYEHTVESTFTSQGGVQHPGYRVDLSGQGELVLAEVDRGRARLAIDLDPAGEFLVSDRATGAVVGQFWKAPGSAVFALAPGTYEVRILSGATARLAEVQVPESGEVTLGENDLHVVTGAADERKGGGNVPTVDLQAEVATAAVGTRAPLLGAGLQATLPWRPTRFIEELGLRLSARSGGLLADGSGTEIDIEVRAGPAYH